MKNLINRWVVLGALGVAAFLLFFSLLIGYGFSPPKADSPDFQVAELTLIPGPTSTPRIAATPTHDPAIGTATPLPGEIALNGYVQISGTDGEGLRLRSSAGLSGEPLFLGFDSEVFQIIDGPQKADGYTWWFLSAPYDDTRAGWAAEAFLESIPSQ
ncbi:MAG: hypothetical protein HN855_03970 [Anaerolineae bacterium]|jgi:hypothetical protein|nr:hypothetical protein [Anaerolineae bacterium]MBT7072171.1 hypothetical protein [Anaerolineae bacterium]MBT7324291.1 hypothetical protein [Anaerolineae bacterium]